MANKTFLRDIWEFLKIKKAWWLAPLIITLIILGSALIVLQATSSVSPFIYVLF